MDGFGERGCNGGDRQIAHHQAVAGRVAAVGERAVALVQATVMAGSTVVGGVKVGSKGAGVGVTS